MLLEIHPENPDPRKIERAAQTLREGGIVVYPTDTVYAIGCDITNQAAVEKIIRFKDINLRKTNLSFICRDISQAAEYVKPIPNDLYKLMRRNLPGAFTFILDANGNVPKIFKANKRTVGVRIPNNNIILSLVEALGGPILTASLKNDPEDVYEDGIYMSDASIISERLGYLADTVIDGGPGGQTPSTVIDCTEGKLEVVRQGAGELV